MTFFVDSIERFPLAGRNCAVTIGNFDGVHRGHRKLIELLQAEAHRIDGPSVVITFDPPPAKILRPENCPPALTWMQRRAMILMELGVDYVLALPTNRALLGLTATEFFNKILLGAIGAKAIVEGPNFRFGKNREGDIEMLRSLCAESDLNFVGLSPQSDDDSENMISSTRIRDLVTAGDIANANRLLVEPYRLVGTVVHGAHRGRTLGFPTANLDAIPVLTPRHGVYAGRVAGISDVNNIDHPNAGLSSDANASYQTALRAVGCPVAINVGPNPTFGESSDKVEVHVLGFEGDLYGLSLEIELLSKLRDVQRFGSKDELLAQLALDCEAAKRIASIT